MWCNLFAIHPCHSVSTRPAHLSSCPLPSQTGTYTTPVKDQGYCGSCWAFSATEQIESDCMRVSGETPILSPEQITQCDSTSYGCNGGWTENAYDYVQSAGGMCSSGSALRIRAKSGLSADLLGTIASLIATSRWSSRKSALRCAWSGP